MKRILSSVTVIFISVITTHASEDFATKFAEIKATGDDQKIQSFLNTSKVNQKDNPEYYALSANYWWALSKKIVISSKPPQKNDLSLTDTKTGKIAGSISDAGDVYPELRQRALDTLTTGAKRFPYRADIVMGLAYIQREMKKYDECVSTLEKLIITAGAKPENILWTNGKKPAQKISEFIPELIQGYSGFFYQRGTDEDDKRCERLCKSTISAFPDHPMAYNMLAGLALAHNQNAEALGYLMTANKKAPNDPIIILNLGDTYAKLGKKLEAKEYYNKVANSNFDEKYKNAASQKLFLLNK